MEKAHQYVNQFDQWLNQFPLLVTLEQKYKVPKVYLTLVIYLFTTISVFFKVWPRLVTNLFAIIPVIPTTFTVAEQGPLSEVPPTALYWILLSLANLFELSDEILFDKIFNFYYIGKVIAFAWLAGYLGGVKGAKVIYDAIKPTPVYGWIAGKSAEASKKTS